MKVRYVTKMRLAQIKLKTLRTKTKSRQIDRSCSKRRNMKLLKNIQPSQLTATPNLLSRMRILHNITRRREMNMIPKLTKK